MENENTNPYADIDKLIANQNALLEQQQLKQDEMLDKQLQMQTDQINRSKAEVDTNAQKTNSALYTQYKKASNKYGDMAENLWAQGLGNSGYAESATTNLYNQYQKNVTDTLNTAQKLKSDFDFQIQQAMQNRDLQAAQFALEMYTQKMNLAAQEYDLRTNKEKDIYNRGIDERNFNYQKERDTKADEQWNKQFDYNKSVNDRNYNYQLARDLVADEQWNKQFDYNKSVNDRNYDYQLARDLVSDKQWQQTFDYGKERDTVADTQWQKQYEQALKEYENAEKWKQINYDYQKARDTVSDNQWNQTFNYNKERDNVSDKQWQQTFDYQKSRDSVADEQWAKEFALAQAAKSSSGSSGGSRSYSSGNTTQQQLVKTEPELSEDAKKLYAGFKILKNAAPATVDFETFVRNAYNQGKISQQDAALLVQMYG